MHRRLLVVVAASALGAQTLVGEARLADKGAAPFSLLPPARCESAVDVRQCLVAQPKEWNADERRTLRATVQRLIDHELIRGILVGARDNGYAGLRRYAT